jgi:hypothetical protein
MASGWYLQFTAAAPRPPTHYLPGPAPCYTKVPFHYLKLLLGQIWPQHHRMPTPNLEVKVT